jgi:hypothetical protein
MYRADQWTTSGQRLYDGYNFAGYFEVTLAYGTTVLIGFISKN